MRDQHDLEEVWKTEKSEPVGKETWPAVLRLCTMARQTYFVRYILLSVVV